MLMGKYAHRDFDRPHPVRRREEVGNNLFWGDCVGSEAESLASASLRKSEEEKEMTHGDSVGQAMKLERGKPTRLVALLGFEKTGGCAFEV